MSFEFQKPSIHNVKNITAICRTISSDRQFACLSVVFHGDGEPQALDVYFDAPSVGRAHAFAAVINALNPVVPECCRGLAPAAECHCEKVAA